MSQNRRHMSVSKIRIRLFGDTDVSRTCVAFAGGGLRAGHPHSFPEGDEIGGTQRSV